jgi:hypothetical protein
MLKTIVYVAIVLFVVGWVYFLYSDKKIISKIMISPETKEILGKDKPILSEQDETLFALLEKNIASGGPGKDGIPAIDKPEYDNAEEADKWLVSGDIILGINYKGFITAYPQRILVWHEVVNETIGDEKISVSYCPLTGTAIGFKGNVGDKVNTTFGVSGKLVNSNLIMYDRASDSYWPQIFATAINGIAKGRTLKEFPVVWTTWSKWKKKYPNTKVLSQKTGFIRNYDKNGDPYGSYIDDNRGYYDSEGLIFKPINESKELSSKSVVVGVRDKFGNSIAVLKDRLRSDKIVEASLGEKTVVIEYDEDLDFYTAKIKENGEWINAFDVMWFAWYSYYPNTKLIK